MKKQVISIFILGITVLLASCNRTSDRDNSNSRNSNKSDVEIGEKVEALLAKMTLEEKIGQMNQYNGFWDATGPAPEDGDAADKLTMLKEGKIGSLLNVVGVAQTKELQKIAVEETRLGIPLIIGYDVIHGFKTIFPIPLGESASWDLEAMRISAHIAAKETAASGIHWTFAPMIDISRDARWGRIMEGVGEDPYLNSVAGVARIHGFQGDDLSNTNTIAACAKHFAGYGFAEAGRDYNTVNIGISELHNTILPPFKAAAKAGVATFMNSFNELDGIPATAHKELQRVILKGDWNYDGFVVSDWASISEMIDHGYAKDKVHAAEIAINAGSDMDMEGRSYEVGLKQLVEGGQIDISLIDDAVSRILRLKFKLGLFDDPYRYCNEEREKNDIYTQEHLDIARDVARKSIVLLKNQSKLLPLAKDISSIAVVGPLANDKDSPLGNWRAQGEKDSAISLLEGIQAVVSQTTKVIYVKGAELGLGERSFLMPLKINKTDTSGFNEAIKAAQQADVVIMALGEDAFQSGEGRSQVNIQLVGVQQELLEAIYKVNKNIVLVLMNGRPLDISWAASNVPSILESWFLGSQSGYAISDVLFGDYNPSGKLPVSFPRNVGQEPLYYNQKNTGRPSNDQHVTYSGYTDVSKEALFPFGYGLSYTTFDYSNYKLSSTSFNGKEPFYATVEVMNSGNRTGKEVVQMYIRDLVASRTRPIKELKGFELITLQPGESKTVRFEVTKETLEFYSANNKWEAEPGEFKIFIGGDSRTTLEASFTFE